MMMIVDSSLSQKEKSSWLGHYLLGRPPRLKRLLKIEDRKSRNTVKLTEKNYPFYLHSFLKGTWQVYTLFYKAQWGKNSQFIEKFTFWKYHFLKIHNFKISFFTKFTFFKHQILGYFLVFAPVWLFYSAIFAQKIQFGNFLLTFF